MSHNTAGSAFCELVSRICERIDSPSGHRLYHSLKTEKPLAKWMPDPVDKNAVDFANDYMISKLLSKWKGWKGSSSLSRAAALAGWESDEAQNRLTNQRLLGLVRGTGFPGSDLINVISTAKGHISRVLGSFRLRKVLSECRWGPGATWDLPRGTARGTKISRGMSTTREAQPFMKLLIEGDPNWCEAVTGFYPSGAFSLTKDFWTFTDASRFATVPKEWDKDRCIDMQPTANGYLQQGVGRYIRWRLKSEGIDLDSQEENQELAYFAYFAELATLDLQSASDSVTYELVSLLLPWDWCQYLCSLRTKYTQFGRRGPKKRVEKFSAMGNAFTFELETLIFWALARATSELVGVKDGTVGVYGDDLVVDREVYDPLVIVLNYCGFRVNESKSFRSGPFYESCGRHFHSGSDVTPVYQKNVVNSPEECIRFHNRMVRWSKRIHDDYWYFPELTSLCMALYLDLSRGKKRAKERIPIISTSTEGDDGFLVDDSEIERDPHGGYSTWVYRRRSQLNYRQNEAAYLQLKLNDRRFSNSDPKGYVCEDSGRGSYRLSRAYFYR